MIRLARYLKLFLGSIVLCIILLFVQAIADLSLPDYTAQIVNTGIQQYGIENAVPEAVGQSTMDKLLLFMTPEEQELVLSAYTLVDSSSPDYETYLAQYPALAEQPVYVRNPLTPEEIDVLNPIMAKAFVAVYGIEQVAADPSQAAALGMSSEFDLSALPEGTDLFALLQTMPEATRASLLSAVNERFANMDTAMLAQSAVEPIRAEYMALGMDVNALQTGYILRVGAIMLVISLISGISAIVVGYYAARVAAGTARNLRRDIFVKVESFSNNEFDKFSVSSLITRTTNDVTQLQSLIVMLIRIVFYAPILGVGGILKATSSSADMWWIIALGVGTLIALIVVVFALALPRFTKMQILVDRLNQVTRENLSGMLVVRAFNTQKFEHQRFDKANNDLMVTNLSVTRIMAGMMPIMMLIMNLMTLLIVWVGAHQVAASAMQVGDMIAFMQYALQVVFAFIMLSIVFILLPRAAVSADRIADVLETKPVINDPEKPAQFAKPVKGLVEFRNVTFRYPGAEEDVLHDLNFTAKPGEMTAFIGSTGSGKSTLINLIPRFYDVSAGEILLDGVDIRAVTQHELRDEIGYVPQKANLFSGTIESNLRYANENASTELLNEATDIAQASAFIAAKEEGLATEVSQGGTNVSGGQRQRLSIARALVKQAPIYIFDDSFSALDFKTDAALRKALKEKTSDSTVLVVTQRVSTIKNAEQIIVLDRGKIVGIGTHAELMESSEIYREIALSQLGSEELAS